MVEEWGKKKTGYPSERVLTQFHGASRRHPPTPLRCAQGYGAARESEWEKRQDRNTGMVEGRTEWMPGSGCWILDPRYSMLDTESRMLVA
jgi:hypothetical protein